MSAQFNNWVNKERGSGLASEYVENYQFKGRKFDKKREISKGNWEISHFVGF